MRCETAGFFKRKNRHFVTNGQESMTSEGAPRVWPNYFQRTGSGSFNRHPTLAKKNMNLKTTRFNLVFFALRWNRMRKTGENVGLEVGKWDKPEILLK